MFRFCLLCLTALVIVKVNDIIPLRMVMKQLHEDSISQAVYVADELLQICRARRVTQLMLPWSESTRRPATFSAPGRGEGAEGKGSKNREEDSLLRGPGPQTWEGQWPYPTVSHSVCRIKSES